MSTPSESRHPILAGLFVASALAIIGTLAVTMTLGARRRVINAAIMEAIVVGRRGNLDKAVEMLTRVVAEHPSNTDALFNYGVALTGVSRHEEADAIFVRLIEQDSADYEAMAERAGIRQSMDDLDGAFSILESIPVGEGGMRGRLQLDPRWRPVLGDPRMRALRDKHGVPLPQP